MKFTYKWFAIVCVFFTLTNCDFNEEPKYTLAYSDADLSTDCNHFLIVSNLDGTPIEHKERTAFSSNLIKDISDPNIHLTLLSQRESLKESFRFTTYINIPAEIYTVPTSQPYSGPLRKNYDLSIKNLGSDFILQYENPFFNGISIDKSFSSSNNGTVIGNVYNFSSEVAYAAFNTARNNSIEKKYYFITDYNADETLSLDFLNLPSMSEHTISLNQEYIISNNNLQGFYTTSTGLSEGMRLSQGRTFISTDEITIHHPDLTPFSNFYLSVSVKSGNDTWGINKNYDNLPDNLSFSDWDINVTQEALNGFSASVTEDVDVMRLSFFYFDDDVDISWDVYVDPSSVVSLPELQIPNDLLLEYPNLTKLNQIDLYAIDLYKNGVGVGYLDYLSYFIKPQPTVPNGKIREETFQKKY